MHQLELDQLRDIIGENEERINNLIDTLNILIEKGEKKQKVIEKLQERLKSI
jgi:nitrogen-specific signal transduction histidine kinase